jgi:flagellin
MALSVQTNVAALTAQRNLQRSSDRLNVSLERLSTGYKINRAADDASGLVISEYQKAQISGLEQAIANTDRAVNLVQTAESGLGEINSILLSIRQLAVDSANTGANDPDVLAANQADIENLLSTIDRIADTTKFGTIKVLNGDSGLKGQVSDAEGQVTFLRATDNNIRNTNLEVVISQAATRAEVTSGTDGLAANGGGLGLDETLSVNGVDITLDAGMTATQVVNRINEFEGATGAYAVIDGTGAAATIDIRATQFGSQTRVTVLSDTAAGATSTGFGTTFLDTISNSATLGSVSGVDIAGTIGGATGTAFGVGNVLTGDEGGAASGISIRIEGTLDASGNVDNRAVSTATSTQGDVIVTNNSRKFQVGAFAAEIAEITIINSDSKALGVGLVGNRFTSLSEIKVGSFEESQDAIRLVDAAISDVSSMRGEIGAFQKNTLQMNQSNLRSELQNLQEAESVIRDTDFTAEIAKFTNEQIKQQAGTTVLGLANQTAQGILALLQA